MTFIVRFWGTRGSIPTPGGKTRRYGGNTSCVELEIDGQLLICDAGTGLRELGLDLAARSTSPVEAHLFFSHTHWDHIQGFPFFVPAYHAGSRLHVFEATPDDPRFTRLLLGQMQSDYFPVGFSDLGARIATRHFENSVTQLGQVRVEMREQTHPGRSFAYAFEALGKRVVYATDNELDLVLTNPEQAAKDPEHLRMLPAELLAFIAEADLLIADAQYTDEEYARKVGWGHSRVATVVDLAVQAGVKQVALFHHDPLHSDEQIDHLLLDAQKRASLRGSKVEIFAAREGLALKLD